jgi:hypothetical protein
MADELDLPLSSDETTPEVEHALGFAERMAEKAGLAIDPEGAPEGDATPVAAVPAGPRPVPTEEGEFEKHRNYAHEKLKEKRKREAEDQWYESLKRKLEDADRRAAQPPPQPAADPVAAAWENLGPEPDMNEDYAGWVRWDREARKLETQQMLRDQLGPIREQFERGRQAEEQERQRYQQAEAQRQVFQQYHGEMQEAARIYAQTPLGQGLGERLTWHFGHPGDPSQNLPPLDGAMTVGMVRAGFPVEVARELTLQNARGIQILALKHGLNPAAVMDIVTRSYIDSAGLFYDPAQGAAPVQQAQQPRQANPAVARAQAALHEEKQATAGARGVTGSAAEAGPESGETSLASILRGGKIDQNALRAYAIRKYGNASAGNIQKVTQAIFREAEGMRRAG